MIAGIVTPELGAFIGKQLEKRFEGTDGTVQFPGEIFGPTSLPVGQGASTEIAVDQADADKTLRAIYDVLGAEGKKGRHLLGPIAVRFVGPTRSLLGMNQRDANCFIEMPSVRSEAVS